MPFGPQPLGLVYFAGVKAIGYSMAGAYLRRKYEVERPKAVTFGIARTLLGVAVGCAYAGLLLTTNIKQGDVLFMTMLIPVRIAEWMFAIWFFFTRRRTEPDLRIWGYSFVGVGYSFLLDVPALFTMFVLPGGAWIC
jgi:hypothetical protein